MISLESFELFLRIRFHVLDLQTAVGYTQGKTTNPTYEDVCSGKTGHVEAVQLEYNSAEVSYKQLLDVFWKKHDPTQKNRQVLVAYPFKISYPIISLGHAHLCSFNSQPFFSPS